MSYLFFKRDIMKQLVLENKRDLARLQRDGSTKLRLWNDAFEYCSKFYSIEDKHEFTKDFISYSEKALRKNGKGYIPEIWERSRLFEYYGLSESILRTIQSKWTELRQITLNEDFTKAILPDVNYYAETPEELQRLESVERLLSALKEIEKHGYKVWYNDLPKVVSFAVRSKGLSAEINPNFIKQKRY